jgi:hypothetical protein
MPAEGTLQLARGPWETALATLRDRPTPPGGAPPSPLFVASWAAIEPSRGRYDDALLERMRHTLRTARARGLTPWVCLHAGALPAWQRDRGGWEDPDASAAWGCYVERTGASLGGLVSGWASLWRPLREAAAHGPAARRVGRTLLDAMATAYLHLRRGNAAGTGAPVVVAEHWGGAREGPGLAGALRRRLSDLRADALVETLRTGRLRLPWAPFGELPNGTGAIDGVIATGDPATRVAGWRDRGLAVAVERGRDTLAWVTST